jgi:glycosyltransferase involved in cell wall biosynthesis
MTRVSIITPAHNSEAFLGEALRSVEAQTYGSWEVVVADDASTDGTAAVAKSFGSRVRLVRAERNLGPAGARNLALQHAEGELVVLLDADDYLLPTFLERQVGAYDEARGSNVGLITSDALVLGPKGMSSVTYRDLHPLAGELTLRRLLERNPVFVSSLFPRRLIDEVGPFDVDIRGAEDFDLWVRIMERGYRAIVTPEPLAVYRRWEGALTASQATSARSERLAYERALARGRLDPASARVARRRLRHARAVELLAEGGVAAARRHSRLLLRVALENPSLWRTWARGAAARARGSRRTYH